jgi:hypothetical protein
MKTMTKKSSTPTKIKAKLGLHAVSDMDVVKALTAGHDDLLNNPAYPSPPVDLATYQAGIDRFSAVIIAVDGGKKATSAKEKQRVVVIKMYTQLGHYVEAACNDDLDLQHQRFYRAS